MSTLPPIPRPAKLRGRDFLVRGGPLVVCLLVAGVVAVLWSRQLIPTNFVGEVQSRTAQLNSPVAGTLVVLNLEEFARVTNGQPLATVAVHSPDTLKANLAALQADLGIMRERMSQDQERNDLNYRQLRVELLLQKLELTTTQIQLRQAESEYERSQKLFDEQLLAAGVGLDRSVGLDVALRDRDALRAQVEQKTALVAELEQSLEKFRPAGARNANPAIGEAIDAAIRAQERLLKETEGPVTLKSPMDGTIMKIYRRVGERVAENELLLEVSGDQPERIMGFVRQPLSVVPQPGDIVQVRSRGQQGRKAEAKVVRVGVRLELFTQPLRVRGFDASMERGLPVLLTCPEELGLHPGELVDLIPLPSGPP